jgi:hypothetical protein
MPQGYPRQGGPQPYGNPQQMMAPPGPNGVPQNYMQGMPMMPNQQPHPSYSPMPQHVTPHMHPAGPYGGSPRPGHMMQHAASHQGFNPNSQHMGPNGPGMQMNMGGMPPMAASPHPHYLSHRHMSGGQLQGGYPQMTPRQGHAMPHPSQPSPGAADEGK